MKSPDHTQKVFSCDDPKKNQNGGLFFQVGENVITIIFLSITLRIVSFLYVYYFISIFFKLQSQKIPFINLLLKYTDLAIHKYQSIF